MFVLLVFALFARSSAVHFLRRSTDGVASVFSGATGYLMSKTHRDTPEARASAQRIDELTTRIALLESDNSALRRQLQYPERTTFQTLGADVIAKTPDTAQQAFIINRGSRDGVKTQQTVITDHGIFVGEVVRVEERHSVVRLPTDRRSRLGVLLAKSSKPIGIVEGGYGLGMRLTLIPPQEVVTAGDVIITSGAVQHIPRGLLVGRVASVGGERFEPFQHAILDAIIPFEEIRHVLVITSH